MTIYFTADTHFHHKNVIRLCDRPFSSIEEMDRKLIENINERVKKEDTLYILGDFSFTAKPAEYLSQINGNVVRVKGSHDYDIKEPYIIKLQPKGLLDEYGTQQLIVLCHYSMRTWERSHYGSWCLWGHSHNNLEPYGLSFDVGVDAWNYYPVSLEEVAEKMATLKPIVDYR